MFKRRRRKNLRSLLLTLFLLALLFYFGRSKIEKVDCQINKTLCTEEIKKEFAEFLGQNFFLINPKEKTRELKASYPYWEKIKIRKIPLNKILVEITTRQPVACLLVENKILLLDQEAVVLWEVDVNPGLPEIETEKFKSEEVKRALEVIALASQYSLSYKRIKIENQGGLVLLLPETEVFLPTEELSNKIASLQMIISRAKIEGKVPIRIDLRFKKPVITF